MATINPMLPAVTGVTARFQGTFLSSNSTNYFYWVQALYPSGWGQLSVAGSTGAHAPAALGTSNFVAVGWNPAPGAIGYQVFRTTSSTAPGFGATGIFIATSETGFKDDGTQTTFTATPRYDGLYCWKAIYDFATDGGAVGAITPAQSDTIPANAIVVGAGINSTIAVLATAGAATISIGTSAGSSATSILAATSKASFTLDALLTFLAGTGIFGAAPFKMTAAGQINITVATNPLTAGRIEINVFGYIASQS